MTIDAEKQQVMVMGSVNSATLINKLARWGKHAELWTASANLPQTIMNANHIENLQARYQHNGRNNEPSSAQNVRLESFHNEDDSGWDTELFHSQNMGTEAEAGKFKQDFVLATEMENIYGGGNGADFVGLGSHEFGVSQGYITEPLVNTEVLEYPSNNLRKVRMNTFRLDKSTNYGRILNENDKSYALRSQLMSPASNLIPSNTNYAIMFSSAAAPNYYLP